MSGSKYSGSIDIDEKYVHLRRQSSTEGSSNGKCRKHKSRKENNSGDDAEKIVLSASKSREKVNLPDSASRVSVGSGCSLVSGMSNQSAGMGSIDESPSPVSGGS